MASNYLKIGYCYNCFGEARQMGIMYFFVCKQIVGGTDTGIYDYPWSALFRYRNERTETESWGCSGSYIGKKIIVYVEQELDIQ